MEDGLELATARRAAPSGRLGLGRHARSRTPTTTGRSATSCTTIVRSNVTGSKMALAIPVKPHDPNGRFHLSSWPHPVVSPGHWIAAYGWWGIYDGTNFARLYYTDSSEDEGGATGASGIRCATSAAMIRDHPQRFVW